MNFLKRKMFKDGGPAAVDERYFFIDKITGIKKYIDPIKLYDNLSRSDAFTITSFVQNPDVTYSPDTQEIFRRLVSEKKSGPSTVDPNLFEFGQALPDYLTAKAGFRDIAGGVGQGTVGIIESGINLGNYLFRGLGEGGAKRLEKGFVPTDILPGGIGSERMPFSTDTMTGAASDTDPLGVYDMGGTLRQGIPQERLIATLSQAQVGDVITDFSEEIAEINEQPIEAAPEDISDVLEPNITAGLPEQLPTLTPITSGESAGQLFEPGTVGRAEQDARRLAYEKSIIGKDEFGFPLPESRLLQDETITEALKELQPAELKVNIDKTEADTLLDTQNKFDGKFDLPKITLDKVDTTKTLKDRDTKTIPVIKETFGVFGSDRFLDFIRNVGGELVRTGQMGEGLASGAAKASEERAARELLQQQEDKKYKRDLALAVAVEAAKNEADSSPDIMKPEKILELNDRLVTDVNEYKGGLAATGFVDLAIETILDAQARGEKVGGIGGWANAFVDKAGAFLGMSKDFENLSAQGKVDKLVQVVRQKNLQAILGESGRTISDKDRAIILEVFGNLELFESPEITLGKLRESRRGLADANETRQQKIRTGSDFLAQQGNYGLNFYRDMYPSVAEVLSIDPQASQSLQVLQRILGNIDPARGDGMAGITDIDL